jgi:hypothetical protein
MPPAMPAAAAPTAIAGAAAFPATDLTVSTTPLLPLRLAVELLLLLLLLRLAAAVPLRLAVERVDRPVPLRFDAAELRLEELFAPVLLRAGDFAELLDDFDAVLDRFALLFGVLLANVNRLLRHSGRRVGPTRMRREGRTARKLAGAGTRYRRAVVTGT